MSIVKLPDGRVKISPEDRAKLLTEIDREANKIDAMTKRGEPGGAYYYSPYIPKHILGQPEPE